jgi:hypothetical protein
LRCGMDVDPSLGTLQMLTMIEVQHISWPWFSCLKLGYYYLVYGNALGFEAFPKIRDVGQGDTHLLPCPRPLFFGKYFSLMIFTHCKAWGEDYHKPKNMYIIRCRWGRWSSPIVRHEVKATIKPKICISWGVRGGGFL